MRARSRDIALDADAHGPFLIGIIALMVFLAVLAASFAMVLSDLAARWDRGLDGGLTVQLPPSEALSELAIPDADAPTGQRAATPVLHAQLGGVLAVVTEFPGITGAAPLAPDRMAGLLAPWLGSELPPDLPIPTLIDVRTAPGADVDLAALAARLGEVVPGATVDAQAGWIADLRRLAATIGWTALGILATVSGAGVLAVVLAVYAGVKIHFPVIELLHLMGATDDYVARQFEAHMLRLSAVGAVAGWLSAALALGVIRMAAGEPAADLMPRPSLTWMQWLILALVPVATCGLSVVTTRLTVRRALGVLT